MNRQQSQYLTFDVIIDPNSSNAQYWNVFGEPIFLLLPQSKDYLIQGIYTSVTTIRNLPSTVAPQNNLFPDYLLNFLIAKNDGFFYGTPGRAHPINPIMLDVTSPGQVLINDTVGFTTTTLNNNIQNLDLSGNGIILTRLALGTNNVLLVTNWLLQVTIEYVELKNNYC